MLRSKKRIYKFKQLVEIEKLKTSKPKEFWKYFKSKTRNKSINVDISKFYNYFSTLSNDISNCQNEEAENFCSQNDFNNVSDGLEELDCPFTLDEIHKAVNSLKTCKSPGSDNLLNEYFISSFDILGSHICDIFNIIFKTGYFPDKWTEGVITPVYKKGDPKIASNYRGITLVSCLSKLFTTVLNKRLEKYCNSHHTITDAQFGFRKGCSTVDAIFILNSIVQKYLNENKRLYVVFVDMFKCFDSIYHNALYFKLFKTGINGKMLRIIRDMYSNLKSCVKICNTYSDFFEYTVGLRQGEVISPIPFSLFVEDLESFFTNKS